jgi:hypothetical protein
MRRARRFFLAFASYFDKTADLLILYVVFYRVKIKIFITFEGNARN